MRVVFISRGAPNLEWSGGDCACRLEEPDLIVLGFNAVGEVSYERELKGETDFFERVAKLSKAKDAVVVCGCVTDTRGHKRKSAVVAENGKLLGVSDMVNAVDGETAGGAVVRVYETKAGRIGVVVAQDLYFPEVINALAVCGSDCIVCPFEETGDIELAILRAHAFCYGVPLFFCGVGFSAVADITGAITVASAQSPFPVAFAVKKEYHLVETRRRGFYKRDRAGMR